MIRKGLIVVLPRTRDDIAAKSQICDIMNRHEVLQLKADARS